MNKRPAFVEHNRQIEHRLTVWANETEPEPRWKYQRGSGLTDQDIRMGREYERAEIAAAERDASKARRAR